MLTRVLLENYNFVMRLRPLGTSVGIDEWDWSRRFQLSTLIEVLGIIKNQSCHRDNESQQLPIVPDTGFPLVSLLSKEHELRTIELSMAWRHSPVPIFSACDR